MNEFIEKLAVALEKELDIIQPDHRFRDYEEWDSLAVLGVLAMINEYYDVTIPRIEFEKLQTVSDLYTKVMELKET